MKMMKKLLCVVLSVLLLCSAFGVVCFAEEEQEENSVTLRFLDYNVCGLPNFKALLGQSDTDVADNQVQLGVLLNQSGFDVIATQEDFGYHSSLIGGMTDYTYKTNHTGSVPGGDGLNVYTKSLKIYNEQRVEWCECSGGIAEGDILTPKGILYTVLDLGNGMTVDFYDIHADAFDGGENALTRAKQYAQLLELVDKNSKNRPVIITGDFNTSLHIVSAGDNGADERAMRELFIHQYGFKDAWIELYNNGNYDSFTQWQKSGIYYFGQWDSLEKYYYRNGGGIEITADAFEYVKFFNEKGDSISDHSGAAGTFTFVKTEDFIQDERALKVNEQMPGYIFFNFLKWVFKDFSYIINHFDEVKALIGLE